VRCYGDVTAPSKVAEIPNKEFWSSLPGLVKDGFAFSRLNLKAKVKGESGGHGTYDRI